MFRRVSFEDPVSCIQKTARFVMPIMSKSCGDLQASAGLRGQYDDHLRGFPGEGIASHWNRWSLTTENPKTPSLARHVDYENSGPILDNLNVFLATNSVLCSL